MLSKAQLETLLGRTLTSIETANRESYLKIAIDKLESLTCIELCSDSEPREFESRENYRALNVGIYQDIVTVKIDGVETTDYHKQQFDKRYGDWFTSVVFTKPMEANKIITVDADWGFGNTPADLQQLIALLFVNVSSGVKTDSRLKIKQIEDVRFTYQDISVNDQFLADNAAVISKYNLCNMGDIQHGSVHRIFTHRV